MTNGVSISRRDFIRRAILISAGALLPFGHDAWAARSIEGSPRSAGGRKRLVVVFLRGAIDGLNVVAPHGDPLYFEARPTIAIPRPRGGSAVVSAGSGDQSMLDLDGHFGMHPALGSLLPLWRDRKLAFIHACGSPDPTRSHFEAQDYIETATPGVRSTQDGWMNRLLAQLPGNHSATEAVNLGPVVPRILSGRLAVANIPTGRAAGRPIPLDRPGIEQAFARLYQGNDPLSTNFRAGETARKKLLGEIQEDMKIADNGAPPPNGFASDASQLARLIARDPGIRLAFVGLGGWDTHVNQGAAHGQLAGHLQPLADGLAGFAKDLGPAWNDTVVVVLSEFGRTVHENGNAGTDHGHANVMWVMGGGVRGGKVYGEWPGLSNSDLYQGRDLAVTTDFREPLALIVRDHMGLNDSQLRQVFPVSPATHDRGLDILT